MRKEINPRCNTQNIEVCKYFKQSDILILSQLKCFFPSWMVNFSLTIQPWKEPKIFGSRVWFPEFGSRIWFHSLSQLTALLTVRYKSTINFNYFLLRLSFISGHCTQLVVSFLLCLFWRRKWQPTSVLLPGKVTNSVFWYLSILLALRVFLLSKVNWSEIWFIFKVSPLVLFLNFT